VEFEVSRARDGAAPPHTTLTVSGDVDLANREALIEAGLKILWSDACLALDLSAVAFMDAAGVAALTGLESAARRLGATFELTAVSLPVYRVLQILGLTRCWSVPLPAATAGG
jgi:anti-anti-sigma factor